MAISKVIWSAVTVADIEQASSATDIGPTNALIFDSQLLITGLLICLWLSKETIYRLYYRTVYYFCHELLHPVVLVSAAKVLNGLGTVRLVSQIPRFFVNVIHLVALLLCRCLLFVIGPFRQSLVSWIVFYLEVQLAIFNYLKDQLVEPEPPHICPPPPSSKSPLRPIYANCSCLKEAPTLISASSFRNQAAEIQSVQSALNDKLEVIRILRGEKTTLEKQRDDLLYYKTKFHIEQAGRQSDTFIFDLEVAEMKEELTTKAEELETVESALAKTQADLQLVALVNEPAPELEEELPIITDEMEKADIINTHYEEVSRVHKSLNKAHASAIKATRAQHGKTVSAVEARIVSLTAKVDGFKAEVPAATNIYRQLVDDKYISVPALESTITSLRTRLASVKREYYRSHTRAEMLNKRIQRETHHAGKETCCHIADLDLDLRAAETLEEERLAHVEEKELLEGQLRLKDAEKAWISVISGMGIDEKELRETDVGRMVFLMHHAGFTEPEQCQGMFRDFPRLQKMMEEAGVRDWSEVERLLKWHKGMKDGFSGAAGFLFRRKSLG